MRRNSLIFEGVFTNPTQLHSASDRINGVFSRSYSSVRATWAQFYPQVRPKWSKPESGMVKANWDAAIDSQSQRMGIGMVLRDETGSVLAAMSSCNPSVSDPTVAEALALWKQCCVY
ncbi:hypothetical protein SLA2020_271950 [Shorea laevis]